MMMIIVYEDASQTWPLSRRLAFLCGQKYMYVINCYFNVDNSFVNVENTFFMFKLIFSCCQFLFLSGRIILVCGELFLSSLNSSYITINFVSTCNYS